MYYSVLHYLNNFLTAVMFISSRSTLLRRSPPIQKACWVLSIKTEKLNHTSNVKVPYFQRNSVPVFRSLRPNALPSLPPSPPLSLSRPRHPFRVCIALVTGGGFMCTEWRRTASLSDSFAVFISHSIEGLENHKSAELWSECENIWCVRSICRSRLVCQSSVLMLRITSDIGYAAQQSSSLLFCALSCQNWN